MCCCLQVVSPSQMRPTGGFAGCCRRGKEEAQILERRPQGADLTLVETKRDGFAQMLSIRVGNAQKKVKLPLVGEFQISNALVAAALTIATGARAEEAIDAIQSLKGASGRLELIGEKAGAPVFVDYAHTPDALETHSCLAVLCLRRLVVVFGAGVIAMGETPADGCCCSEAGGPGLCDRRQSAERGPALIRKAILAAALAPSNR